MFSNRINSIKISSIIKYNDIVKEREKNGIYFYKANIGSPNIDIDEAYFKALSNYNEKKNEYSSPKGLSVLRQQVSEYYNKKNNREKYSIEDVIVTQGASDGIIKALFSICDKNDEIIVLEPFFSDYKMYCNLAEVNMITISEKNITYKNIKSIVNEKTKAILFANPNNPDGNVLNKKEISAILKIAKEKKMFVISDEVYSELVYTNEYYSLSNYDYENIVIVDSASKKLNACGSRIGFVISKNENLIEKIRLINDSKISISNVEQLAVASLFSKFDEITKSNITIYKKRLEKMKECLEKNNIKYVNPQGGICLLVDLPVNDSENFALWLASKYQKDNKTLLVTSAKDFYQSDEGKNKMRLCLTINENEIESIVKLLCDALKEYEVKI